MDNAKIAKIFFRFGMIDTIEGKSSCKEHILAGREVPLEVQRIFNSDKIAELSGKWGVPELGSPIQYHWALVELDNGKSYEIEVYNLAIMILHSEDERIKRLFRFLVKAERCIKAMKKQNLNINLR